ncbi:hypothetical protein LCGC14_2077470 [marine sediment metagenome]|uniref:Uncharacterized protein n=1 Tax=marine sediment metagenome TaxID=412755 RepID=A0A0F9HDH9_9ZZZZ
MIDLLTLKASRAIRTGDVRYRRGEVYVAHPRDLAKSGTVEFDAIEPDGRVLWMSAEVLGVDDPGTDAVRIRFSNGSQQYYLDQDDFKFKLVTDTDSWVDEYTRPHMLGNIDLWTQGSLKLVVHLVVTKQYPDPRIKDAVVLLDLPAWEGAAAQAIRIIATGVRDLRPILIHGSTLTEDTSEFNIGSPYSEHQIVLEEIVQVTLDGVHKSAELSDGKIVLLGPPARAGQAVKIAATFVPTITVRRVGEIRVISQTPAWVMSNLILGGGLNGRLAPVDVSGTEVERRYVDLQITARGASHRQADALAMRAAILEAFSSGFTVCIDSGRTFSAQIENQVEVLPGGSASIPEAIAIIRLGMTEFTSHRTIRNSRVENDDGSFEVMTNVIALGFPDAGLDLEVTSEDFPTDCQEA